MYLLTNNPNVKNIREFTDRDRIAVPAVKVSIQALVLQMAAAQTFGDAEYAKTRSDYGRSSQPGSDGSTDVRRGHRSGINSNFTAPPYSNEAFGQSKDQSSSFCL
jgi:NitT/TauT family transport system substrate-binding protein